MGNHDATLLAGFDRLCYRLPVYLIQFERIFTHHLYQTMRRIHMGFFQQFQHHRVTNGKLTARIKIYFVDGATVGQHRHRFCL